MSIGSRARQDSVLWWPLALAGGIASFFALPNDPAWWWVPLASLVLLPIWWKTPWPWRIGPFLLLLATLGFSLALFRTEMLDAPRWNGSDRPMGVTASVEDVTVMPVGVRLMLSTARVDKTGEELRKIRVVCRACTLESVPVGARVDAFVSLTPPAGPVKAGGFDFRRVAYFRQIGAVGFVMGVPKMIEAPKVSFQPFAAARQKLARIVEAEIADKDTAALGIALLTGIQTALSDDLRTAYQISGLAHIYSISGLHLSFVAGFLFFLFRGALALIPSVALRWPTKKIAAVLALIAVILFTLFAGDSVPTWRSLLMTALVLLAVMTDRFAFTLRVVALAACAILAVRPEMLFDVGFQLSFAAVTALVAWMEWVDRPAKARRGQVGIIRRHARIIRDVAATSLLATLATLPFILYSFGRLSVWSVAANMIGVPLTAFIIMPLVLLTLVLFPFGLAQGAIMALAPALAALNAWAYEVAGWPYADERVALIPGALLLATAIALYVACAHPKRWTFALLVACYIGIGFMAFRPAPKPDLYVSDEGLIALHDGANMWVSSTTKAKFVRGQWQNDWGVMDTAIRKLPIEGAVEGLGHCDRMACVLKSGGQEIAVVRNALALPSFCQEGTPKILIAPDSVVPSTQCPGAITIVDRVALKRAGTHAMQSGRIKPIGDAAANRVWAKD